MRVSAPKPVDKTIRPLLTSAANIEVAAAILAEYLPATMRRYSRGIALDVRYGLDRKDIFAK